jgi:hypothetical protein
MKTRVKTFFDKMFLHSLYLVTNINYILYDQHQEAIKRLFPVKGRGKGRGNITNKIKRFSRFY